VLAVCRAISAATRAIQTISARDVVGREAFRFANTHDPRSNAWLAPPCIAIIARANAAAGDVRHTRPRLVMRVTFSLCGSPKPSRQISRNGLTAQNTTACAEERGDSAGRLCHEEEARTSRASTHDVGRGAPGRSLPTIAIITRSRSGPRTPARSIVCSMPAITSRRLASYSLPRFRPKLKPQSVGWPGLRFARVS
jgi:hypothetical protein